MREKIRVSEGVNPRQYHDIMYVRDPGALSSSDEKEMRFWSTNPLESPQSDLFDNIVHKSNFIRVFDKLVPDLRLSGDETVLELGGGHCWSSVLLKRSHPECYVVASDLSPDALLFSRKYEGVLKSEIDEKWAFNSRNIPFEDGQFDLVFAFAAFHHFSEGNDYGPAIKEAVRMLRPGGRVVLLYEPSSPRWLYKPAFWRANRKRAICSGEVDEDLFVVPKVREICGKLGCRFEARHFTSFEEREGVVETVYFYALTRLKPLRRILPCTVNMVIEKPGRPPETNLR